MKVVYALFGDEVKHETNTTIKILFSEALTAKKIFLFLNMMQTSGKSMTIEENVQITPSKNRKLEQL